jgi:hypothetical protein
MLRFPEIMDDIKRLIDALIIFWFEQITDLDRIYPEIWIF